MSIGAITKHTHQATYSIYMSDAPPPPPSHWRSSTKLYTQLMVTKKMAPCMNRIPFKSKRPLRPVSTPSTRVELMVSTQKKILRYVTIRLKWKPAFTVGGEVILIAYIAQYFQKSCLTCFKSLPPPYLIKLWKPWIFHTIPCSIYATSSSLNINA